MNIQAKNALSAVLAVLGSVGVVFTAVLAVKEHGKAEESKKKVLEEKPDASKFDIIATQTKAYAPAIAVGTATVASIMSSHALSYKAQASLIAGATLLEQGWKKYQYKVKDILGIEAHEKVLRSMANDDAKHVPANGDKRVLYYVEPIGFFRAKPEDLAWAYGDMNQRLHTYDDKERTAYFCLLYDMIKDAKGEILNKKINPESLNWGWSSVYLEETQNGVAWVHMTLKPSKTKDGLDYILIQFDEAPIFDPSNGGSAYYENAELLTGNANNTMVYEAPAMKYKKVVTLEPEEKKDE